MIQWVPAAWLQALGNPSPSPVTDLGTWHAPEAASMDQLLADIQRKGMRDPFFVGVGRVSRLVRLETGNQRIGVLLRAGFEWLPAVAYVGDHETHQAGNGSHRGIALPLALPAQPDIMGPYPIKEFRRLSEVLELQAAPESARLHRRCLVALAEQHPL